jgi:hypothetical protein
MDDKKNAKNAEIFSCDLCHFICSKKSNYDKHILTLKHKRRTNGLQMDDTLAYLQKFICDCGCEYKHRQGLWKHKKKCDIIKDAENAETIENQNEIKMLTELVKDVVKQNQDLTNKLVDICKNGTNNTITNNTNSHNKSFNLNFFLNETCKDAMNIMDFVDSIKLQLSDLENVGKIGFVEGISSIIVKNLNSLDETKRPVHCTDSKREVMYVKDEDKWEKENDNKLKIRKAIKNVAHKNSKMLNEFRIKNPDCLKSSSKVSDKYNKLVFEALGGKGDNDSEKEDKIIKNIAKKVIIDKTSEID